MTTRGIRSWARAGAAAGLALGLAACAVTRAPDDGNGSGNGTAVPEPGGWLPGRGTHPKPPPDGGACRGLGAPGALVWTTTLGAGTVLDAQTLVDDHIGDVLFAHGTRDTTTSSLVGKGEVQLSELDGMVRAQFPAGVAVAADAHGDAFVAGSFTQPVDFGLGVLTPQGNVDVFVVELDAKGRPIAQHQLGLCGDGVEAIAVAPDGRIAVSGDAMGTAVISAKGKLLFVLPESGKVAFDSHGDLVVAGTQGTSGFIAAFDATGQPLWSHVLTGTGDVFVTGVALDAHDDVVIGGFTTGQVDLFGTTVTAHFAGESGRVSGGFAAKLDPHGAAIWAEDVGFTDVNAVAVAPDGSIAIAGAQTGNAGFFRIIAVAKLDAAGVQQWIDEQFLASGYGTGLAATTDACDAVYVSAIALDTPSPISPLRTYVVKLAP